MKTKGTIIYNYIKKAPEGRYISRNNYTPQNAYEPRRGETLLNNIIFKLIFIYAKQFISLQKPKSETDESVTRYSFHFVSHE
jgi:hypothetical protein